MGNDNAFYTSFRTFLRILYAQNTLYNKGDFRCIDVSAQIVGGFGVHGQTAYNVISAIAGETVVNVHADCQSTMCIGMFDLLKDDSIIHMGLDDLNGLCACGDNILQFILLSHADPMDCTCGSGTFGDCHHAVLAHTMQVGQCGSHDRRFKGAAKQLHVRRGQIGVPISGLQQQGIKVISCNLVRITGFAHVMLLLIPVMLRSASLPTESRRLAYRRNHIVQRSHFPDSRPAPNSQGSPGS